MRPDRVTFVFRLASEWASGGDDGAGGAGGVFVMAGMAGTDGLWPVPGCAGRPILWVWDSLATSGNKVTAWRR